MTLALLTNADAAAVAFLVMGAVLMVRQLRRRPRVVPVRPRPITPAGFIERAKALLDPEEEPQAGNNRDGKPKDEAKRWNA